MKTVIILFSLMLFISPVELHAQTAQSEEILKTNNSLVSVPVIVSDREGHYIPGLKKEDFTVYQDGVKQNITFFAKYDEPLNIALLLDTSGSTEKALGEIKDAAKDFIKLLNPDDQCLLVTFDARVNVLNSFTSDHKILENALDKAQTAAQDGTVIYRAVAQISQKSFDNVQGRKVIVILSDGKDFGSFITKNELLNQLEESDVLIYTIFYKTGVDSDNLTIAADGTVKVENENKKTRKKKPLKNKGYSVMIPDSARQPTQEEIELRERNENISAVDFLRKMSDITAGRFYLSDTPNLRKIFKQVAGELREQYRLGYRSKDAAKAGGVHDITVKVEHPDVVVRTREKLRAAGQ